MYRCELIYTYETPDERVENTRKNVKNTHPKIGSKTTA